MSDEVRKGGRKPMITREFINDNLRRVGYSDPDNMSEQERFDAAMRLIITAKPCKKTKAK